MKGRGCLVRVFGTLLAVLILGAAWLLLAPQPRDWDWRYRDVIAAQKAWDGPYPSAVRLEVAPSDALTNVPLTVLVTGLRPHQRVGLRAWTVDKEGRRWETSGLWQADAAGVVDLSRDLPLGAPFTRPDPSALLTEMRPVTPVAHPLFRGPLEKGFEVHIRCPPNWCTSPWSTSCTRWIGSRASPLWPRTGSLCGAPRAAARPRS